MNCSVIMDLLPTTGKPVLSGTGKSATLQCSFSGVYKQDKTVDIEVLYTRRATGNQTLKDFSKQLEALLEKTPGQIVRVAGQLRCLQFQDRASGMEIRKYQLAADSVTLSNEKKSMVGNVFVEGRVRALSNEPLIKRTAHGSRAHFWLYVQPEDDYHKLGYMGILLDGYDSVAARAEAMKLREKSLVYLASL